MYGSGLPVRRAEEADASLTLNYVDFVERVCVSAVFQGQEDVGLRKGSELLDRVLLVSWWGLESGTSRNREGLLAS